MNYITPAELFLYYDKRRVLELCSDTGTPATEGSFSTNTIALTAIRNASATIDSSVQTGRRYERQQLEDVVTAANAGLATEAEKKRAEPIKSLTAHLAWGFIVSRRGFAAKEVSQLAPMYADALTAVNLLSSGQRILDLDGPKNAGVPKRAGIGTSAVSLTAYNPMFGVFGSDPSRYLYPFGV